MADQIILRNIPVDALDLDQIMERLDEFLQNDHLNTVALLTRTTLLAAAEDEAWRDYLKRLDVGIIGEKELLEAGGIKSGRVWEEAAEHVVPDRVFWQFVRRELGVFLLCESEKELSHMKTWMTENYPGIRIVGETCKLVQKGLDADHIINLVNSTFPDVIVSGLAGRRQEVFLMQQLPKVFGKLWLSLGTCPHIVTSAGMKISWMERRKITRIFQRTFVENE